MGGGHHSITRGGGERDCSLWPNYLFQFNSVYSVYFLSAILYSFSHSASSQTFTSFYYKKNLSAKLDHKLGLVLILMLSRGVNVRVIRAIKYLFTTIIYFTKIQPENIHFKINPEPPPPSRRWTPYCLRIKSKKKQLPQHCMNVSFCLLVSLIWSRLIK